MKLFTILALASLSLAASANAGVIQCSGNPGGNYLIVAGGTDASFFYMSEYDGWKLDFTGKIVEDTNASLKISFEPSREVNWGDPAHIDTCHAWVGTNRFISLAKNGASYMGTMSGHAVLVSNPAFGPERCPIPNPPRPQSANLVCGELRQ